MKLYLDDQFEPVGSYLLIAPRMGDLREIYLTPWHVVRSYEEFVHFVTFHQHQITHISFDHDLDQYEHYAGKTGLDAAKWTKEYFESINKPLPQIYIHSRNYYGTQDILKVFPQAIY